MSNKIVRLMCGASGIDIGAGWGLYVSAQDNDLGIDRINPDGPDPIRTLPMPTNHEAFVARMAVMAATVLNRNMVANEIETFRRSMPDDVSRPLGQGKRDTDDMSWVLAQARDRVKTGDWSESW